MRDFQDGKIELNSRLGRGRREIVTYDRGELVTSLCELGRLFDRTVL